MENAIIVRIRTWTSPEESSESLIMVPRPFYEDLEAFVELGAMPGDPGLLSHIVDVGLSSKTREERSAVAARVASRIGTPAPAPAATWTTVAY